MNIVKTEKLEILINFLRELPEKDFDLSHISKKFDEENVCGTVCCAAGWCPKIFPDEVMWKVETFDYLPETSLDVRVAYKDGKEDNSAYSGAMSKLFGISVHSALNLFDTQTQKNIHSTLSELDSNSTPKEMASMLEQFLDLVSEGEIWNHDVE